MSEYKAPLRVWGPVPDLKKYLFSKKIAIRS